MATGVTVARLEQSLRDYQRKTGYSNNTLNLILQNAAKIKSYIEHINLPYYLRETGRTAFLFVRTLAETCFDYIFDPSKGYIFLTNSIAAFSKTVEAVLGLKARLPRKLQAPVAEINIYLTMVNARLNRVENCIAELLEKIDKACRNDFTVSRREMQELESEKTVAEIELEACQDELKTAQELLQKLESAARKVLFGFGLFTLAAAVAGGVLLASTAAAGSTTATVVAAVIACQLLPILRSHSQLMSECESIKEELRKANLRFRENRITIEDRLAEELALLDIRG